MPSLRQLAVSLLIALPASAFAADTAYTPAQCVADLDDMNAFIEANDAGAASAPSSS